MAPSLRFDRPDTLHKGFGKRNVIVLGAPAIGKTELFEKREEQGFCSVQRELTGAINTPGEETVVVDDFSRAYLSAGNDRHELLTHLLNRERGVCLVTRPRSLDWLFESNDTGLTADMLSAIDDVYCLRYDPRDDRHLEVAAKQCSEIWQREGYEDARERADFEDVLSSSEYFRASSYVFQNEVLRNLLQDYDETYPETLLPPLIVELHDLFETGTATNGLLSPRGVKDFTQNFTFSKFYDSSKEALSEYLDAETLSTVSAAVAVGGPASIAAVGLILWSKVRDDSQEDDLTTVLERTQSLPPTEEQIEIGLDLPPYTIDNFRRLSSSGNIDRLLELAESAPNFDEFERAVETLEDDVSDLQERIRTLELESERVQEVWESLWRGREQATRRVADLGSWLVRDEISLLRPLVSDIDPDDIPLFFNDEDSAVDPVEQVVSKSKDGGIVVLEGPHGTGKTTVAYRACRQLIDDGYAVRIPNFRSEEQLIKDVLGDLPESKGVVLYTSYVRGNDVGTINGRSDLELLSALLDDYCSTVVLECRSELFSELRADAEQKFGSRWDNSQHIEFKPLSTEKQLSKLVTWVASQTGVEEDIDSALPEITRISARNAEIAKIAARFAFDEEQSLADFNTASDLVRGDLRTLIGQASGVSRNLWELFYHVSALGSRDVPVRTKHLKDLLGFSETTLKTCITDLYGYLDVSETAHKREDAEWHITPDVYADVVFQYCLFDAQRKRENDTFDGILLTIFSNDQAFSYDGFLPTIAHNLSVAYDAGQQNKNSELTTAAIRKSNTFLRRVFDSDTGPGVPTMCVRNLAVGGVPFDIDILQEGDNLKTLTRDMRVVDRIRHTEPVGHNIFGYLCGAQLAHGSISQTRKTIQVVNTLARVFEEKNGQNASEYLSNVYSIALASPVDMNNSPGEMAEWIEEFVSLVNTAATDGTHDLPAGQFLENVYSMALTSQATKYDSPEEVAQWIEEFVSLTNTVAIGSLYDGTEAKFLPNVYSMALKNLADTYDSPREATEWTEGFVSLINTIATDGPRDVTAAQFLPNVYSMALSKLVNTYDSPDEVAEWIEEFVSLANTAATDGPHDLPAGQFLENMYAMVLISLVSDKQLPEEVTEWIEEFVSLVNTAASDGPHDKSAAKFLVNIYSKTLSSPADTYDSPEEVIEWIEKFASLADIAATDGPHDNTAARFLENVYMMALISIVNWKRPSEVRQAWVEKLVSLANTTATNGPHDESAVQFLENVYSMALKRVANGYDSPEETTKWIEEVISVTNTAAINGPHNESPVIFLAKTFVMALVQLTRNVPPNAAPECHEVLFTRAVGEFDTEEVTKFYTTYLKLARSTSIVSQEWVPWLVADAVERCFGSKPSICDTNAERVDLVAHVAALAIHHRWRALNDVEVAGDAYFKQIVEGVRTVENDDHQSLERIVSKTATLLEEEYVSGLAVLEWEDAFNVT